MKSESGKYEAYATGAIYGQGFLMNILEHIGVSYLWMTDTFYLMCQLQSLLNNHLECYAEKAEYKNY